MDEGVHHLTSGATGRGVSCDKSTEETKAEVSRLKDYRGKATGWSHGLVTCATPAKQTRGRKCGWALHFKRCVHCSSTCGQRRDGSQSQRV